MQRQVLLRRSDGKPGVRLVKTKVPAAVQVRELNTPAGATTLQPGRLQVTLNPALVPPDVKDMTVLLWLQDEPEPLTLRVLVLPARKTGPTE
jgi:hypothetical protein